MSTHTFPLSETSREHDLYFLDRTLSLAARGEGQVKPNPLVGAVVVKKAPLLVRAFTGMKASNTPRCWLSKKLVRTRDAQLST